jgi:hypothetical protein
VRVLVTAIRAAVISASACVATVTSGASSAGERGVSSPVTGSSTLHPVATQAVMPAPAVNSVLRETPWPTPCASPVGAPEGRKSTTHR